MAPLLDFEDGFDRDDWLDGLATVLVEMLTPRVVNFRAMRMMTGMADRIRALHIQNSSITTVGTMSTRLEPWLMYWMR